MRYLIITLAIVLTQTCYAQFGGMSLGVILPSTASTPSSIYGRTLTIDHTLCGSANSDTFTVLVSATNSTLKSVSNGGHVYRTDGYDIRFFITDTTSLLNWAVEYYDPVAGTLKAWVKVPSISYTTNTVFKMSYGSGSVTTFQGGSTGAAWKSTVVAAYFMNDATGNNLTDNSANANTATQTNSPVRATGQIQYAESFTSASANFYTTALTAIEGLTNMSMVFWAKRNATSNSVNIGKHAGAPCITAYVYSDGYIYFQLNAAYGYVLNNTASWQHYGFVFAGGGATNADKCKIYKSGSNQSLSFVGTIPSTTTSSAGSMIIGRDGNNLDYTNGLIDMLLFYKEAVSSSWMTAMYNNQNNPGDIGSAGFITFSSEY